MNFSVRSVRWSGDLTERVSNRSSAWSRRDAIVVSLAGDGRAGLGVAAPLPSFSPDKIQDVVQWIARASTVSLSDVDRALGPLDQLLCCFTVSTCRLGINTQFFGNFSNDSCCKLADSR